MKESAVAASKSISESHTERLSIDHKETMTGQDVTTTNVPEGAIPKKTDLLQNNDAYFSCVFIHWKKKCAKKRRH